MLTRLGLRTFATTSLKVFNNVAKQQFMTTYRGTDATIEYALSGKTIELIATTVPVEFQGKGVGKLLAKHAFDHAKKNKLNVIIRCHFLEHYYRKNSAKYEDLNVKIELTEE